MKKYVVLIAFSYMVLGSGITVQLLGAKVGLDIFTVNLFFIVCVVFFIVIVLTSLKNIKEVLTKNKKS